ncbi:MAG: hypothetical protein ACI3XR_04855 [Eubacteriales bacterium]
MKQSPIRLIPLMLLIFIFMTGCSAQTASSVGIVGGADGPTLSLLLNTAAPYIAAAIVVAIVISVLLLIFRRKKK